MRGAYVAAAGFVAVIIVPLWNNSTPDEDGANIGAGLLWFAGWAVAIAGTLLLAYDLVSRSRRRDGDG